MLNFSSRSPVFGRVSDEQWNWLCDNVGEPQKDWVLSRGAVWFRDEKHKVLYLLRWR